MGLEQHPLSSSGPTRPIPTDLIETPYCRLSSRPTPLNPSPTPAGCSNLKFPSSTLFGKKSRLSGATPNSLGVIRNYRNGPLVQMRVLANFDPLPHGGTRLSYKTWVKPRNILGRLGWPLIAAFSQWQFGKVFKQYDQMAQERAAAKAGQSTPPPSDSTTQLARGGSGRIGQIGEALQILGYPAELINRLNQAITKGDPFDLSRMRPYSYADRWQADRLEMLDLFMHATREGLLALQWDVMCPYCRGTKESHSHLAEIGQTVHCDSCAIDFEVNFDRFVEISFAPNPSIRHIERLDYCVAGPEVTPHIVAQQLLPPRESRQIAVQLVPGPLSAAHHSAAGRPTAAGDGRWQK